MAADWQAIKAEYITTGTSYRKLAVKYGVHYSNIAKRGKDEDWAGLRQQQADKTQTKILNAIGTAQAQRAARLQSVADKLLGKIETLLEEHEELLVDTQAMRHISATLKDIKEIQFIRADSDMREQEARIKKLQREAEREDQSGNTEVEVTILGGEEEWQK